jgi:hypothetical protein
LYSILTVIAFLLVSGLLAVVPSMTCTNVEVTRETLTASGFCDVKTGGYRWVGCGRDRWATEFTAVDQTGTKVVGAVCCGGPDMKCRIVRDRE